MILLIFFCFLLQSTLFQSTFAVADVAPNLMVILTVSFGLMRGKREGMFVGFLGGILSDLFFRKRPGLYRPSLCDHRILLRFLLPYFLR